MKSPRPFDSFLSTVALHRLLALIVELGGVGGMLSLLDLIQLPGQDIDPGLDSVRNVGEDDEDPRPDPHHPPPVGEEHVPKTEEHADEEDRDGEKGQEDVNEGEEGAAHGPGRL